MYDIFSAFGGYSDDRFINTFGLRHWITFSVLNFYVGYDNAVYLTPAFRLFSSDKHWEAINSTKEEYYEVRRNLV